MKGLREGVRRTSRGCAPPRSTINDKTKSTREVKRRRDRVRSGISQLTDLNKFIVRVTSEEAIGEERYDSVDGRHVQYSDSVEIQY